MPFKIMISQGIASPSGISIISPGTKSIELAEIYLDIMLGFTTILLFSS
jgi:hypothetical protein